jgi:hypothetical protein
MMAGAIQDGLGRREQTSWVSVWGERQMYFFHIEADEDRKEKEEKWREAWRLIERALSIANSE